MHEPLDEFFFRTRLQDPETDHEFLRFGERTVGNDGMRTRVADPCALGAGLQSVRLTSRRTKVEKRHLTSSRLSMRADQRFSLARS